MPTSNTGLVPRVVLQTAGRAQLPTAPSAASAGFEVESAQALANARGRRLADALFKNESAFVGSS